MQVNIDKSVKRVVAHEAAHRRRHQRLGDVEGEEVAKKRAHQQRHWNRAHPVGLVARHIGQLQQIRRNPFVKLRNVRAVELDQLDEHDVQQVLLFAQLADHPPRGVAHKIAGSGAGRIAQQRQDRVIGMALEEDRFPDLFLAGEVIVDAAHGNARALDDLAHGGAVITLLHEERIGRVEDAGLGLFSFAQRFIDHQAVPNKKANVRYDF